MENYLMLNGKRVELTAQQVAEIKCSFGIGSMKLSEVAAGRTFTADDYEFVVLEQSGDTTAVILKGLYRDSAKFGDSNNFDGSDADRLCAEFADEISSIIGSENLIKHTIDLTSDDGMRDYGKIKRKASLLTCNQYRKYVDVLDKYKLNKWWWLATAYSTPSHNHSSWVKCVSLGGGINFDYYYFGSGVRPFCIFNSNIFVSCQED